MNGSHAIVPKRTSLFLCTLVFASAVVASCSWFGITRYDPTTYKNLTDLKPEVAMLYESFATDRIDTSSIRSVRLKLEQMYEYEKGKGDQNSETVKQIEIIRDMFKRHVADRLTKGNWTEPNMKNNAENISDAFDIAIATEKLKNQ